MEEKGLEEKIGKKKKKKKEEEEEEKNPGTYYSESNSEGGWISKRKVSSPCGNL
jgi:hypothetical protein